DRLVGRQQLGSPGRQGAGEECGQGQEEHPHWRGASIQGTLGGRGRRGVAPGGAVGGRAGGRTESAAAPLVARMIVSGPAAADNFLFRQRGDGPCGQTSCPWHPRPGVRAVTGRRSGPPSTSPSASAGP